MVCMAMVLVSCSGDDGEQGPQGVAGVDGKDGADGVDGNANVFSVDFDLSSFEGNTFEFDMPVASEEIFNYAFFYYVKDNIIGNWYSVPGQLGLEGSYTSLSINEASALGYIYFFWNDNTPFDITAGQLSFFRIVGVEIGTLANKNGNADIMAELKSAGVDTSDYHAVAAYFGLE